MITDVPGYTWGIVPAFAHSGVKYFTIGPNGGDRIGHTIAAWGDKPFWWIGPNGKDKVLVWMTGTGYYHVFSSADNLLQYLGRLEEKGYPYDFVQVRHCLGDNGAPGRELRRHGEAVERHARLSRSWSSPRPTRCFATSSSATATSCPPRRAISRPTGKTAPRPARSRRRMNRASADRLTQAETLFAMFNPQAYPAEDFYQAWRNVILYDEHTWGAHNSISQPDEPFVKSQWAIKRQFALDADEQSRKLLAAANASRGAAVASPADKVQAIDVINTTSFSYPWTLAVVPQGTVPAGDVVKHASRGRGSDSVPAADHRRTGVSAVLGGLLGRRFYITSGQPAPPVRPGVKAEGNTLTSVRLGSQPRPDRASRRKDRRHRQPALSTATSWWTPTRSPALNDYFYLPGSDLKGLQRNGP